MWTLRHLSQTFVVGEGLEHSASGLSSTLACMQRGGVEGGIIPSPHPGLRASGRILALLQDQLSGPAPGTGPFPEVPEDRDVSVGDAEEAAEEDGVDDDGEGEDGEEGEEDGAPVDLDPRDRRGVAGGQGAPAV